MKREEFEDTITMSVRKELEKIGINDGVTYFPMLRKEKDQLFIVCLVELPNKDLYNRGKTIRPKYWALLNINNFEVLELNNTKEKDFMETNLIPINQEFIDEFKQEGKILAKYATEKRIKYKDYIVNDIKNDLVEKQSSIIKAIDDKIIVDNNEVNATEYLINNIEKDIEDKVNELMALIVNLKYSAIIYYYEELLIDIIEEYKNNNHINLDKMKLAMVIISNYYGKYCGIEYLFNI